MAKHQILIDGVAQTGIQTISTIDTISGCKKFEARLGDSSKFKTIDNFADVEIWGPCKDPKSGIYFEDKHYVELSNKLIMDPRNWAISWWMRAYPQTHPPGSGDRIIFAAASSIFPSRIEYNDLNDITLYPITASPITLSTGLSNMADEVWHHYVLNCTNTNTILYVDGVMVDTGIADISVTSFKIRYICWDSMGFRSPKCDMSTIRVYSNSIDQEEVTNLHKGVYSNPCLAFYTMTQSTDAVDGIYDRRGFSHGTSYEFVPPIASVPIALPVVDGPVNQFISFNGRVELVLPDYDSDTITISGRDYISELLSRAIIESYGSTTPMLRSNMIKDLLIKYGSSMTYKNVTDSPVGTECEYFFKTSAWDALVKCAGDDHYKFWVDMDKDVHYVEKGFGSSTDTLEVGVDNFISYRVNEAGSEVVNRVTIYGYDDGTSQVVAMVENLESQETYHVINEKRLVDLSIMTEADAIDYGDSYLADHAFLVDTIDIEILGKERLEPGNLVTIKIPNINIDGDYLIIDRRLGFPHSITSLRVAEYSTSLETVLAGMVDKILMLERYFIDTGGLMKIHRINEYLLITDYIVIEIDSGTGWTTVYDDYT